MVKTKYSHIYKGTLYLAETVSVKSSDSNTYYVDEIFYKFQNISSTCTIRRPTGYSFKGEADNFVSRTILGTQRPIYQSIYSHGTCFDDKILYYNKCVGYTLLSFFLFPIFILFCFLLLDYINKKSEYNPNIERRTIEKRTVERKNKYNSEVNFERKNKDELEVNFEEIKIDDSV